MRITLANLQADSSGIAIAIGIPPSDSRFTDIVNQAQQSLLERGEKFYGTIQSYKVCATDDCFTWPRQFAAIEKVDICGAPISLRSQWYEFLMNGPGMRGRPDFNSMTTPPGSPYSNTARLAMYDRGTTCTFADATSTTTKIKVYADVSEIGGAQILLQGYDINGNWIRTQLGDGSWVDGEYVNIIAASPALSVNIFWKLTGVQKPITNGNVRIYAYDTVALTQTALGIYAPDETIPSYRRSHVPGLSTFQCCGNENKAVNVLAKMAHIPVSQPTDYMILTSIPAFRDMCLAVKKARDDDFQGSTMLEQRAVARLQAQMKHFSGDGNKLTVTVNSRNFNSGAVENMI